MNLNMDHQLPSSAATSSSSSPPEDELELTRDEKELQRIAEEIAALQERSHLSPMFLRKIYNDLTPELKDCLLCFSIFPENRIIKRRVMIYWWIGEELVAGMSGQTAEQAGEKCFEMLIDSKLIQPIHRKHSKTAKHCIIFPKVRQLLLQEARKSEFFTFDPQDQPTINSGQCKRACLVAMENDPVEKLVASKPNELQLVFNLSKQNLSCDKDQLKRLKSITALQLGRWQNSSCHHIEVDHAKFLDGLRYLKRLRYLSLQGISQITELPKTIGQVKKLLIMNLRSCHSLQKLPLEVTSITSLTHLDISECFFLDKMPKGIGLMTNLQVLKGFVVGSTPSIDPCRLSDLTHLNMLWKLSIRIGSEVHIDEDLSELRRVTGLRSLKIAWESSPRENTEPETSRSNRIKGSAAPAFSLPYLEKLVLECVPGDDSVSWLTPGGFFNLKRLYIVGGKLRKLSLGSGNDRWNVETLRLKYLKELELEWDDLKRGLLQLRCAEIHKCPKIGSLPELDDNGYWNDEASSSSMAGTSTPVRMRNEEASSSSMARTNAPVRTRNEEEASSSSMARTNAPVRTRNEEEASSSSMDRTNAPVQTRNEEEASSSSCWKLQSNLDHPFGQTVGFSREE